MGIPTFPQDHSFHSDKSILQTPWFKPEAYSASWERAEKSADADVSYRGSGGGGGGEFGKKKKKRDEEIEC